MSKKAIVFTLDGVRSDAVQQVHTPYLDLLASKGASAFDGRCAMPAITTPNHAALFRGVNPQQHGIIDNYALAEQSETVCSLFDKIYDSGRLCAAVVSYLPLLNAYGHCEKLNFVLHRNISTGVAHGIPDDYYKLLEDYIVAGAQLISEQQVDLAHVYIEAPDVVGHNLGWMSDAYMDAVSQCDQLVRLFIESLGEQADDYVFLVTTDHGGHGKDHGEDCLEDRQIWFIAAGEGIKSTRLEYFSIIDIMPTLARLLEVPAEVHWQGEILDILQPDGQLL